MMLYKYAGTSGTLILEALTLKVSPPNQFNDPFELTPVSKFTYSRESMLKRVHFDPESFRPVYMAMVTNESFPFSFERFILDLPAVINEKYSETAKLLKKHLSLLDLDSLNQASNQIGILCFARNKESICMWAHYANQHKGMAIGLDFSYWFPKIVANHGPVLYRNNRCRIDPQAKPPSAEWKKDVTNVIFTKSKVWEYEMEYRYVMQLPALSHNSERNQFMLHIDSLAIREVIFGCWTPEEDIQRVRVLFKQHPRSYGHINLFRCERHRSKFVFNIMPC